MTDSPADLVITGCTVLVHDDQERVGFEANATIVVRDGVIESVTTSPESPPAAEHLDARGQVANVESSDPDALMTWLQGRGDIGFRSQKPLRLRGDVTIAPDGFAIDAMKAEIDGGAVEGRIAVSHRQPGSGSKITAELKAERLDLDAAPALARSLAGPQAGSLDQGLPGGQRGSW